MKRKYIYIIVTVITLFLIGIAYEKREDSLGVKVELINPQVLVWDKPITDEQWAEDVKKESFHIKSTGVLQTMVTTHTEKLERIKKNGIEYIDCPDCIRYDIRKELQDRPELVSELGGDINIALETLFQERLARYNYDIEKLTQSVERMNKELELREKGFVVVDDDKDVLFQNAKIIREIND